MITAQKQTTLSDFSAFIAVLTLGVMAGFFWTYAFNVNYATISLDADEYVRIQSLFNVNVRHGMFFSFFFGAALLCFVAALISWSSKNISRTRLLLLAGFLYLGGVVIFTHQVNLPLNVETESWVIGQVPAHWKEVRAAWNDANLLRTGMAFLAFALGLWSLMCKPSAQGQS